MSKLRPLVCSRVPVALISAPLRPAQKAEFALI